METTAVKSDDFEEDGMLWLQANRDRVELKTTGRRLTSLKAFAKWAGWSTLQLAEYRAPTPLKGQPHPLPEGMDGIRRMIEVSHKDAHKALTALCGFVGLRVAEALAVVPDDFNLNTMMLVVYGKGDKERIVPISDECWLTIQMPVFRAFSTGENPSVVGLKDRYARATLTRLGEMAGLQRRVASHDLRATFATELYNRTLDQRLVQYLLGHASADQTSIYIERSHQQLIDGVNLL